MCISLTFLLSLKMCLAHFTEHLKMFHEKYIIRTFYSYWKQPPLIYSLMSSNVPQMLLECTFHVHFGRLLKCLPKCSTMFCEMCILDVHSLLYGCSKNVVWDVLKKYIWGTSQCTISTTLQNVPMMCYKCAFMVHFNVLPEMFCEM